MIPGTPQNITEVAKNSLDIVTQGSSHTNGEMAPPQEPRARGEIACEDIFEILKNRRRRYALHYLKQNGSQATVGEMSRQIAAWENDVAVDAVTSKQRKKLYTALYQSHLPRMHDANVVEYDQRRGTVELTDEASDIDLYLEFVPGDDIDWAQYYLALAGISAALLLAHYLEIYPFTVSGSTVTAIIVTAFAVSAFVHLRQNTRNRIGGAGPPPGDRGDASSGGSGS